MSNKHTNHQHGLTTMNASRPKSKLSKRANKAKAKLRKAPLLAALHEARYGKKAEKVKAVKPKKSASAAAKKAKAPAKKTAKAKKA